MLQYEKKYDDFKFFGAVPYDFEDLSFLEVSNVDFNNLKKHRLGMVVNLDKHNMKGSHWVALYIDLEKDITAPEENAGPTAPSPLLSIKSIPTEYPLPMSIARLTL